MNMQGTNRRYFRVSPANKYLCWGIKGVVIGLALLVGCVVLVPGGRAYARTTHASGGNILQDDNGAAIYAVVYDVTRNRYYTYGSPGLFTVASSIKVPILLTFLDMTEREGRSPTDEEQDLMTTMIENSNNDSASALYDEVGGPDGVAAYIERVGLSGLAMDSDAWGWSRISPRTMVDLLTLLNAGSILTEQDRNLVFNLMQNVEEDQRVGVGDSAPAGATVSLKDGWVVADDDLWAVNSSGIVATSHETYIISVYTQHEPSLEAGQNDVRQVCANFAAQLV